MEEETWGEVTLEGAAPQVGGVGMMVQSAKERERQVQRPWGRNELGGLKQ